MEKRLSTSPNLNSSMALPIDERAYGPSLELFEVYTPTSANAYRTYRLVTKVEDIGPKPEYGISYKPGVRLDFNVLLPAGTTFTIRPLGNATGLTLIVPPGQMTDNMILPLDDFPGHLQFLIDFGPGGKNLSLLDDVGGQGLIVVANINGGGGNQVGIVGPKRVVGTLSSGVNWALLKNTVAQAPQEVSKLKGDL